MTWFIVSVLSFALAYLGDEYGMHNIKRSNKIIFRCLLVLVLSYITGLGGEISTDHHAYLWHYNNYANNGISSILDSFKQNLFSVRGEGFEPLFALYNVLLSKLGFSAVGFFFVTAVITNGLLVSVIFRFRLPYLSVLFFLVSIDYFQEVNLVRQMLAASLCFYAIKYIDEKNLLRYIIIVLAASLIHTSALIMLPMYLISYLLEKKNNEFFLLILFGVWLFSLLIGFKIVNLNIGFLSLLSYYEEYTQGSIQGVVLDKITNLIVFAFFVIAFMNKKKETRRIYVLYFVLGCVMRNFAVQFYWFYRVSFYFSFIICCFVPDFFSHYYKLNKNSPVSIPVIVFLIYNCFLLIDGYIVHDPVSGLGTVISSLGDIF